jgi:phosphopantothenoylcysteine decarboxylase/phosphopantothenate--cysteine ligase
VDVVSADEMRAAVLAALPGADALLMAAAVADFKPAQAAAQKIKKQAGAPTIQLALAADILAAVADYKAQNGFPRITVGFAAESQALLENAQAKLVKKKLDLIVANDISARDAGFAVDENRVTLLDAAGGVEPLPLMSKAKVAEAVLERLVTLLTASDQPL